MPIMLNLIYEGIVLWWRGEQGSGQAMGAGVEGGGGWVPIED